MKYELNYSEDPSEITATAMLRHEKARSNATERFIIDTGSPISMISEITATNMQLKDSIVSYDERMMGVGGEEFRVAPIHNVKVYVKGKESTYKTKQKFYINPQHRENILGMDFLEKHNLSLEVETNPEKIAKIVEKNAE